MMITIIGTGHIFRISEQIAFAIKHIWPDAVLVELDGARYKAMTAPPENTDEAPKIYKRAAEYQEKMASEYGTTPGSTRTPEMKWNVSGTRCPQGKGYVTECPT